MSAPALEIRGLAKRLGKFQLGPIDLTVPRGGVYGLIGPNGAGKTTTIDLVMGMGAVDAGTIAVYGFDHWDEEVESKLRIGYVSPNLSFTAWGRIRRLLKFLKPFYPNWDDAYCDALLERFQLDPDDRISTLSHGERTKLNLVTALAHRPPLLLLDEPQTGLDALAKRQLFTELLDAMQDEDRAVLISSHNLDEIERYADHIGVLDRGELMIEGATTDLLERYRFADATAGPGWQPAAGSGLRVLDRRDGRVRLLVDTHTTAPGALESHDALTGVTVSPLTLEELFVSVVTESAQA